MRKLSGIVLTAALLLGAPAAAEEATLASLSEAPMTPGPAAGDQTAVMCFKTGEQRSGMNKICFYNCVGSATAITVGAAQLCPISINQ